MSFYTTPPGHGELLLSVVARDYLACKDLMDRVNQLALGLPEMAETVTALNEADEYLRSVMRDLPKATPIQLDDEPREETDVLSGDSTFSQLRRKQAKEVSRRLLKAAHPDSADPERPIDLDVKTIKNLADAGEVEVLYHHRARLGFDIPLPEGEEATTKDELLKKMGLELDVRLKKLKATNPYKLAILYYSNRPCFLDNAKRIFSEVAAELRSRADALRFPAASLLAEDVNSPCTSTKESPT